MTEAGRARLPLTKKCSPAFMEFVRENLFKLNVQFCILIEIVRKPIAAVALFIADGFGLTTD
jgi:hypothetical protein